MQRGPLTPINDDWEIPQVISQAIRSAMKITNAPPWLNKVESSNALSLWLEPSYRAAKALGMSDEDYARFAEHGYWNLAGDTIVNSRVSKWWKLAGPRAWVLVGCQVSPSTLDERIEAEGIDAVIETAEHMIALRDFAEGKPEV